MAPRGQMLGFDFDDIAIIPVKRAMRMFNRVDDEIHAPASSRAVIPSVMEGIKRVIKDRHDGEEDITGRPADALTMIDEVLSVLTSGAGDRGDFGAGGRDGDPDDLWVGVHERTAEIGLVKALGATDGQVMLVFLAEAAFLSLLGGAAGDRPRRRRGLGDRASVPGDLGADAALGGPAMLGVSLTVGILAGPTPAARAARLDPVDALRAE